MSRLKSFLALAFFLVLVIPSFAQTQELNPKSVQSITLRIVQTGELIVTGSVDRMNLTLYIPQDGVQQLDVSSNQQVSWKYGQDKFGNKVVVMEWANPIGTVSYQINIVVKNEARLITNLPDIGSDPKYLGHTSTIVINDDIRKIAYPYEKSWSNVAQLTEFVYNYVNYDISTVGQRYSSAWVLENKRGVCVEHANLLTALLRASGIPTRYVVGYAYSSVDKKLIGHTWVEVLASDGSWIPFDPTWLEGIYVDATHIKTANLLDDNQLDVLTYLGSGQVTWKRGSSIVQPSRRLTGDLYGDTVSVINYTARNITTLTLSASTVGSGDFGYIKAAVSSNACAINSFSAASCVDKDGTTLFDIMEENQSFFSCGSHGVYWFYRETGNKMYICPASVFDQIGSSRSIDVEVGEGIGQSPVSISGPSIVNIGEQFRLTASSDPSFIFYSPDFGQQNSRNWDLKIFRPGTYRFYLYSSASLAQKNIIVVEQKEFNLTVDAPASVKQNSSFIINVTAKNLLSSREAKITIDFGGQRTENIATFAASEEKKLQFNVTSHTSGSKELVVAVNSNSLTPYSTVVNVEAPKGLLEDKGILGVIIKFFASIASFFGKLF